MDFDRMVVVSMNSKRQRRPNVRLGEIGDISAAFACGFSQKTKVKSGPKRWKHDDMNHKQSELNDMNEFSEETSPRLMGSNPGVSPKISADFQQNRENKNPNSSRSAFQYANSNEANVIKSKLDFSNVTRKCRAMKRRGRSVLNCGSFFVGAQSPRISREFSCEEGTVCAGKEFGKVTSDASNDHIAEDGFKDFSDQETTATSKEECDCDVYWLQSDLRDLWNDDICDEENNAIPELWDEMRRDEAVNSVDRWLDKLGFGKYAALFEMHEVDEEALPLLTLEDLKEMGVFAVGPRRKLYAAIQKLRDGNTDT